jgi:hypothetical protein
MSAFLGSGAGSEEPKNHELDVLRGADSAVGVSVVAFAAQ